MAVNVTSLNLRLGQRGQSQAVVRDPTKALHGLSRASVYMGFGVFSIFRSKGVGQKFSDVSRRGVKNFRRVVRGGGKKF